VVIRVITIYVTSGHTTQVVAMIIMGHTRRTRPTGGVGHHGLHTQHTLVLQLTIMKCASCTLGYSGIATRPHERVEPPQRPPHLQWCLR
jgi:hypothetical protein